MKKILAIVLLLISVFAFSSCEKSSDISYVRLDMSKIDKEYAENAARAKETYEGTYVEVTGTLVAINSYSDITVHMPDSTAIDGKRVIVCSIRSKEVKDKLKTMSVNDIVTVKGQISQIHYFLWDCKLDVYEIN